MDRIITKEAKVNGVRIHYRIAGRGSPLLLLHGSRLTSRSWLKIIPALAESHYLSFIGAPESDGLP
jgi:pimeloyl-ACP methyl ester carboxylesterase